MRTRSNEQINEELTIMKSSATRAKSTVTNLNTSAFTLAVFEIEDHDDLGFFTSNSRITIPANVKKIKISFQLIISANATGTRIFNMLKNGNDDFVGGVIGDKEGDSTYHTEFRGSTAVLKVTEGDYFEFDIYQNSGAVLELFASKKCWASIEVIE